MVSKVSSNGNRPHRDGKDRQFVTALARGLDILRCFDRPGAQHSVSAIARRVKLNQPTTWRLCNTLIECGYLVRSPSGSALRVGAPALTLGYAAIKGLDLPAIALPYMHQLTERTRGSTTLSLRNGIEMISVERCDGEIVLPNEPVGWRAAMTSGPSGLAVLAALPTAEREHLIDALRHHDPASWPRRLARIDQARGQYDDVGYVTLEGMLDGQYSAVAIPLIAEEGASCWAISCGGLRARWSGPDLAATGSGLLDIRDTIQPALVALGQETAGGSGLAPKS